MKGKILNILIAIVIAIIVITTIIIIIKYLNNYINEKEIKETIKLIKEDETKTLNEEKEFKIGNYKVIGMIKIDKINIEYPIIEDIDSNAIKKSIIKYWGANLNEIGNLTLAGHSNKDGTMFGKLKRLELGDLIQIDSFNTKLDYRVFSIDVISPNDISCLEVNEKNTKEVTLITCINGNKNRLVIKAREIWYRRIE